MSAALLDGDEFLTAHEVADLFNVSIRSVRTWVKEGKLPAVRVAGSGVQRFRRSDAMKLIESWG